MSGTVIVVEFIIGILASIFATLYMDKSYDAEQRRQEIAKKSGEALNN